MLHREVASLYMAGHVSPCQALFHSEQTSNPIWMAVYGTGCCNMVIWFAVCSSAPRSQDTVEVMPHLCIDDRKRSTPVRRRFSRTQVGLESPITGGRAPTSSKNECSREVPSNAPLVVRPSLLHWCPVRLHL